MPIVGTLTKQGENKMIRRTEYKAVTRQDPGLCVFRSLSEYVQPFFIDL
jgi:hypothetical protein